MYAVLNLLHLHRPLNAGNSGWYDPLIQNQAYVDFATNAPGYGQLQSDDVLAALNEAYFGEGGCRDQEAACYAAGETPESNAICIQADDFCVRLSSPCPLPPITHSELTRPASM